METCTKIGKKSLVVVCVMVLVLLSTLTIKSAKVASTASAGAQLVLGTPQLQTHQSQTSTSSRPRFGQSKRSFARDVAAAAASGALLLHPLEIPESPPRKTQQKDRKLAELEEAIKRIKQRREQIERFKTVIDDIRNKRYQLHKPCSRDPLPSELQGTYLKLLPKEVLGCVIQFLHFESWYHKQSFYVPIHYSENELLTGTNERPGWYQRSTLNFIDGNPNILELATYPILPEDRGKDYRYKLYKHVDSIIIDTTTCNHTIKRIRTEIYGAVASYKQRAIGRGFHSTTNPELIPLVQQLSFIGNHGEFRWLHWREDNRILDRGKVDRYDSRAIHNGVERSSKYPYDREKNPYKQIGPFTYGLQRKLKNGKTVWVIPKGEYVGIYEKAQRWFDEYAALQHPAFKNESVIEDATENKFHLVQVVQEETPVYSISLPHTPVYLKDKDGNEIRGCLGYPPFDATAHLRSPFDYPDRLDAIALGFDQTNTNDRCSLYKQRGYNVWEYPPTLLLDQSGVVRPLKKTTLYHGEKSTISTHELHVIAVQRAIKGLVSGKLPPLE